MSPVDGWGLRGLSRLTSARSRSITAENRTGAPGGGARASEGEASHAGRHLGRPWKVSPCDRIGAGQTLEIASIEGPGVVRHVWMTLTGNWRKTLLRVYWEGQAVPSIEVPVADFFASGWGRFAQIDALPVQVNPGSGFNCFWEMPFREGCRITLENLDGEDVIAFYQIDYTLEAVPEDCAYLHASWRRSRLGAADAGGPHTLLAGARGPGHYVGTMVCWGVDRPGWWGEGEVRFFLDGDGEHPTLCGTGTEDYFGGSYNFEVGGAYREFSGPFMGMPLAYRPDPQRPQCERFALYRFHLLDPIRFERELRADVQVLGWSDELEGYELRADDIASTALWYQGLPAPEPATELDLTRLSID